MNTKEFNLLLSMADYLFAQIQARQCEDNLDEYDNAVKELIRSKQQFVKEYKKLYGKIEDKII